MQVTKSPIYQSAWCMQVDMRAIEMTDCADIRALASTYGATAVSLDTAPYFLDGGGTELELINPSPVLRELQQYGPPGVRSIIGYTIDRSSLKPGEEAFWAFYLRKIVPACIGSNEKGEQKRLRQACLKALYANEPLLEFITHVVLPGEDMTKPSAIVKLFNDTFSSRTIERELTDFRKEGRLPITSEMSDKKPPVMSKHNPEDKAHSLREKSGTTHQAVNEAANDSHPVMHPHVSSDVAFNEPDDDDDIATPRHQHHIAALMHKNLGIRMKP